jgi:hypothetical protein
MDIAERKGKIILIENACRNFPLNDFAKYGFAHFKNL